MQKVRSRINNSGAAGAGTLLAFLLLTAGCDASAEPTVASTAPGPGRATTTTADPAVPREISASGVDGGVGVYDLKLGEGGRFRLTLPTALATDLTLREPPAPAPITLEGPEVSISLTFEHCPNQAGMSWNSLGSTVATVDDVIRVCRPDEFIAMEVRPALPFDPSLAEAVDLRPIELGPRYRSVLIAQWEGLASCGNCAPWGPMVYPEAGVAVNRTGPTQVTAVDLETLAEVWTVDTGGFDTYLHGGPAAVYLEVTGGPLLSLDPENGSERWRIERDPDERNAGLSGHAGEAWLLRSSFSIEGDDRPPLLRRIDPASGEVLWTSQGRAGTEWQWDGPVVIDGHLVIMDVTNNPGVPVDPAGGAVLGFELASGEPTWTTGFNSPTEAYDFGLIAVFDFEDGSALIVRTIDGDIVRIEPGTGAIRWRTLVANGRLSGTEFGPGGRLALAVMTPDRLLIIDSDTGATISRVDR